MKQTLSTLYIFLKQEWITVGVYCITTVIFFVLIFVTGHELSDVDQSNHQFPSEFMINTLFMLSILSVFVGVYLGSGFLRLKQSPLWMILPSYKKTLVSSFVMAAMIYAAFQSVVMLYAGWPWPIAVFALPSVTLLASQMVIGSNFIMKVILPISPFVLFQLINFEVNQHVILVLVLLFASLAVYLNYQDDKVKNESTLGLLISGNLEQQLMSKGFQKLNNWIGDLFIRLGAKNRSTNLSVALMRPSSRFCIPALFISLLSLLFFYSMGELNLKLEAITGYMLISILSGVFIELTMLAKQCKPFAHLYSENNYWFFKKKILSTLQIHVLIQSATYIVLLSSLSFWLTDFIDQTTLLRYALSVTLVSLIFLPALLCLNWSSLNFKLLTVLLIYSATSVLLFGWFYDTQSNSTLYLQIGLTVVGLITIGLLAMRWWKTQPIELFFRTHG